MLCWHSQRIQVITRPLKGDEFIHLEMRYHAEDQVEEWMQRLTKNPASLQDVGTLLIRLVVFVGLLSHDQDTITPHCLVEGSEQVRIGDHP